jgi:hypothetical protein
LLLYCLAPLPLHYLPLLFALQSMLLPALLLQQGSHPAQAVQAVLPHTTEPRCHLLLLLLVRWLLHLMATCCQGP